MMWLSIPANQQRRIAISLFSHILFTLVGMFLLSSCILDNRNPRETLKSINDYIVYYGEGQVSKLGEYNLAIIQPDSLSKRELFDLSRQGTLIIAYLSVGEAEPERPWYTDGRISPAWLLGKNENWGSYFVDANQPGWQQLMLKLTGEYLAKGFDGIFLDTVDTVDAFPETTSGMIALIKKIREVYPKAILIQNRGFSVIKDVAGDIDGVMFEDLSTTYDFEDNTYEYIDNSSTAQEMVNLHKQTNLPILALDYAPPDNPGMAYRAVHNARNYGFIPAVSVINLDEIPDYHLKQGGPANIRISSVMAENRGEKIALVIRIDNIGLSPANAVLFTISVDGQEISRSSYDFSIGESFMWVVIWDDPKDFAHINAKAIFQDASPSDNRLNWTYKSASLAIEPLLPPDQQRSRSTSNGPDLIATEINIPIMLDGDLSEWHELPFMIIDQSEQISYGDKSQWSGNADLSGQVFYGWDNANIYIAGRIWDDIIVQKHTGSSLWKGDHVELWFDTQLQLDFDSTEAGDDDYQIGISPGDFVSIPPDLFIFTPPTFARDYAGKIDYVTKQTSNGYSFEIMIPIEILKGLRLAEGHKIGVTFEPSDTDTPGSSEQELMMSSAPGSSANWGNPTLWNNLLLYGQP